MLFPPIPPHVASCNAVASISKGKVGLISRPQLGQVNNKQTNALKRDHFKREMKHLEPNQQFSGKYYAFFQEGIVDCRIAKWEIHISQWKQWRNGGSFHWCFVVYCSSKPFWKWFLPGVKTIPFKWLPAANDFSSCLPVLVLLFVVVDDWLVVQTSDSSKSERDIAGLAFLLWSTNRLTTSYSNHVMKQIE